MQLLLLKIVMDFSPSLIFASTNFKLICYANYKKLKILMDIKFCYF